MSALNTIARQAAGHVKFFARQYKRVVPTSTATSVRPNSASRMINFLTEASAKEVVRDLKLHMEVLGVPQIKWGQTVEGWSVETLPVEGGTEVNVYVQMA